MSADPGTCVAEAFIASASRPSGRGTTLPLIIFAAGIVYNNYKQDRRNATQQCLETVRSIRLVLDAEMQRITGALQVLSLTNALRDGDFEGFAASARSFLDQYGEGGVILVANREGRQVFSSLTTDTWTQPARYVTTSPWSTRCLRKKPVYSNLFFGSVKKTADRDGRSARHRRATRCFTTSPSVRRSKFFRP